MGAREEALAFDAEDRPVEAEAAYRAAIASSDADLNTYLNLAVLYFKCFDFGYAAHHKLPDNLYQLSLGGARQVLQEARQHFGERGEIEFWEPYIPLIYLGGSEFQNEAEQIVKGGETLVPYFYLFGHEQGEYIAGARQLLDPVSAGRTVKERYIRGVLQSHFHRHDTLLEPR